MGQSAAAKLGPHVYTIADLSYCQMMAKQRQSQAILISGELGAGKTETTKIVMFYLTALGSAKIGGDERKEEKSSAGDLSTTE